jgi:hypothetical protein
LTILFFNIADQTIHPEFYCLGKTPKATNAPSAICSYSGIKKVF